MATKATATTEPRRRAAWELAAAGTTLAFWVATKPFAFHLPYILAAIAGWGIYCTWRLLAGQPQWQAWGLLPKAGWGPIAAFTFTVASLVLAASFLYGIERPSLPWPAIPLYVLWAFAQEFAVQAIVVASLEKLRFPRALIPLAVGLAFALAHLPALPLALLAGAAGLAWTWMYLRWHNLWAVAASHALVGGLALVLLLGDNPVGGFYGIWAP